MNFTMEPKSIEKGMTYRWIAKILCVLFISITLLNSGVVFARKIDAYFAPNGGFAKINNSRRIKLPNGKKVLPTMNNAVLDLVLRAPKGCEIKIVMYNFSLLELQKILIDAVLKKNIRVKVILDGVASWTKESIDNFIDLVKKAKKGKKNFDFQMKIIKQDAMVKHERIRTLDDKKIIYGTMHEKFGIIYDKTRTKPVHSFAGSSNLSNFSDIMFAENRIVFKNSPIISGVFAQEFGRLWNHFGTAVIGKCPDEEFVEVKGDAGIRVIFNAAKYLIKDNNRIDNEIIKNLEAVDPEKGSIDIAMFSFTHYQLAQKVLKLAKKYPKVKVRIMLDQSQMQGGENRRGLMSLLIEKDIVKNKLKNVSVRYKWRANAYGHDEETDTIDLNHFRCRLLHHKFVVVDKKVLLTGSYNWSQSAEFRNLENLMVFYKDVKGHSDVIKRFLAEYDFIWNSNIQTITAKKGIKLSEKIKKVLSDPFLLKLRNYVDTEKNPTMLKAYKNLGVKFKKLRKAAKKLVAVNLLKITGTKKGSIMQLAD